MKEATGDMTMTIVVIVGIVAVLAIASKFIWPNIKNKINNETNNIDTGPALNNINGYSYFRIPEDYNI